MFWRRGLADLDGREWEELCDGCGLCCLAKLERVDGSVLLTDIPCGLLDVASCGCSDYANRTLTGFCEALTPAAIPHLTWLPDTCAYRLVHEGRDLPEWHHLVSGSRTTVHDAGVSARRRCRAPGASAPSRGASRGR